MYLWNSFQQLFNIWNNWIPCGLFFYRKKTLCANFNSDQFNSSDGNEEQIQAIYAYPTEFLCSSDSKQSRSSGQHVLTRKPLNHGGLQILSLYCTFEIFSRNYKFSPIFVILNFNIIWSKNILASLWGVALIPNARS